MRSAVAQDGWRRRLRREIGWLLLAKLGALIVLWALFFSPAHRPTIDARTTADRFAVAQAPASRGSRMLFEE